MGRSGVEREASMIFHLTVCFLVENEGLHRHFCIELGRWEQRRRWKGKKKHMPKIHSGDPGLRDLAVSARFGPKVGSWGIPVVTAGLASKFRAGWYDLCSISSIPDLCPFKNTKNLPEPHLLVVPDHPHVLVVSSHPHVLVVSEHTHVQVPHQHIQVGDHFWYP